MSWPKCFQVIGGIVNLNLGLDEVITLTTLNTGSKGQYPDPPPKEPFPLPYTDDFECKLFKSYFLAWPGGYKTFFHA